MLLTLRSIELLGKPIREAGLHLPVLTVSTEVDGERCNLSGKLQGRKALERPSLGQDPSPGAWWPLEEFFSCLKSHFPE